MIYHKNNIYGALNAFINQELLEDIAAHINDCALLESQGWGFHEIPKDKLAYADLQEIWLMQTIRVHVDGSTAYCYPKFGCRFLLHAVEGYEPETAEDETALSVPVRLTFRGKKYEAHCGKVYPDGDHYLPEFPGIATRHDFIPAMSGSEAQMQEKREAEAERFLRQYYPAALEKVIPVPIRQIAEKQLHMSFIMDKELSDDFSTLGETVFETRQMNLRDPETGAIEPVVVRRGTAVIDSNVFWRRGYGSMNFTIAHEVYHWFAHRAHWTLMQYVSKPADYGHLKWVMEVQAKAFAGRVLMPKRSVKLMYADLLLEYSGSDETDTYEMIISRMAQFFQVSKTTVRIRLKELGLHDDERKPAAARRMLDIDEVFELYASDKEFRRLLDDGEYLYVENYIVKNDDLYIDEDQLTSYARSHLSECTLSFREKRISVSDEELSSGMQSYQRFTLTFDYDVSMKASPEKMEKAGEQLRKAFEAYVASEESQTFCEFMYPNIYDVNTEHLKPDVVTPEELAILGPPPEKADGRSNHRQSWKKDFVMGKWNCLTEPQVFQNLTQIQWRKFTDLKNGKWNTPNVTSVIAVCAGYHVDYETMIEALNLAGHHLVNAREHIAYKFLFKFCHDRYEDTDTFNTLLLMLGMKPVGTPGLGEK